jgi:hypothetical protein
MMDRPGSLTSGSAPSGYPHANRLTSVSGMLGEAPRSGAAVKSIHGCNPMQAELAVRMKGGAGDSHRRA